MDEKPFWNAAISTRGRRSCTGLVGDGLIGEVRKGELTLPGE